MRGRRQRAKPLVATARGGLEGDAGHVAGGPLEVAQGLLRLVHMGHACGTAVLLEDDVPYEPQVQLARLSCRLHS